MVYVPEGPFTMGSSANVELKICQGLTGCERSWFTNEEPVHTVTLDAFWIDQTEVTTGMYAQCAQAGACLFLGFGEDTFFYWNHPILFISWNMAKTYCEWAGGRLPTEAEWEKAARGTDGKIYPWGDSIDKTYANYNNYVGDTTAVGQYESGKSFYGAYDMAGNASEWVADWYGETYYTNSPASNPTGPTLGTYRVLRGGDWSDIEYTSRVSYRHGDSPDNMDSPVYGIRCARSH